MSTSGLACPHCHEALRARGSRQHVRWCWTPRSIERMLEILRVEVQPGGCWFTRGRQGLEYVDRPKLSGRRVERWIIVIRDTVALNDLTLEARHSCDDGRCVRPDHISAGTKSENARDAVARGQQRYGGERSAKMWATRRLYKSREM